MHTPSLTTPKWRTLDCCLARSRVHGPTRRESTSDGHHAKQVRRAAIARDCRRARSHYHALEAEHANLVLLDAAEAGLRELLDDQVVGTDDLMRALTTPMKFRRRVQRSMRRRTSWLRSMKCDASLSSRMRRRHRRVMHGFRRNSSRWFRCLVGRPGAVDMRGSLLRTRL